MIHNSFRRIALAQGLLPTSAAPVDISGTAHATAWITDPGRRNGPGEQEAGFPPAAIDAPSERQIQV